jgi:uncharacterized iron-regulated membrane protein
MEQQKMKEVRSHEQAALEDVFFGQSVILWARWSVILAGAVLVLWTSTTVAQLTRTFPFFLVLMAMNFFLHGRYVMGSPLNRTVVVAASVADLVLITGIVAFWPGAVGLNNQFRARSRRAIRFSRSSRIRRCASYSAALRCLPMAP